MVETPTMHVFKFRSILGMMQITVNEDFAMFGVPVPTSTLTHCLREAVHFEEYENAALLNKEINRRKNNHDD